jgi:predicted ArsR family transcriptional regulator
VNEADLDALSSLAEPTRRRLYEVVAGSAEPKTRDEAAQATGIDRALAAYHLDKLVEQGLLEFDYARPPGRGGPGAGRPAKRYRRAAREFAAQTPPRDYRLLAELLAESIDDESLAAVEKSARRLGRRLGTGAGSLVGVLRRQGYEPFEAERGVLRLRNCPFDAVAARHPERVCALNVALVRGIVAGAGIAAEAVLSPVPGLCCVAIQDRRRS